MEDAEEKKDNYDETATTTAKQVNAQLSPFVRPYLRVVIKTERDFAEEYKEKSNCPHTFKTVTSTLDR